MAAGSALDLVVIAAAALAAWFGYRLGLLRRFVSWVGLAVGVVVASLFLPALISRLSALQPGTRLAIVLAFVIGLALAGQGIGMLLGDALRANVQLSESRSRLDAVAGAALGVIGVVVLVWLLEPAFSVAPGWPARAVRSSTVVRGVDQVTPQPPGTFVELGRMVAAAPFPEVFENLVGAPSAGRPPTDALSPNIDLPTRASVVKIEGEACNRVQDGSGWVVAPGQVVTNAHVVAGERSTSVVTVAGARIPARVVAFDPRRDLAVLQADQLDARPLPITSAAVGDTGAVYGFPGGGALRPAPYRVAQQITAVGRDLYGRGGVRRDVFLLSAALQPGDSGSALVNQQGRVVGVAFAIDPSDSNSAYAVTANEVRAVTSGIAPRGAPGVDTGPCLVG